MLGAVKRKFKFLLAFPWLAGNRFQCVFCGGGFRKMFPKGTDNDVLRKYRIVGAGRRENAECPWCGSSDRERLLYLFLKNKTGIFSEKMRLLHVAPEWRLEKLFRKCPQLEYVTSDINGKVDVLSDLQKLPFESKSFDAIICSHVLEHIDDDRKAMRELFRVLKKGGWAVLQVPISRILKKTIEDPSIKTPAERLHVFGQEDHVRIYGRDYVVRLKKTRFDVKIISAKEFDAQPNALNTDENVYFCRRQ
jgi:predicted SAM-dependent methyltransferase